MTPFPKASPPIIALAVVLAGSAVAEPTDYVLVVTQNGVDTLICAKSLPTCEVAREAIRTGRWPIADPGAATSCRPAPGCFDPASNVIRGFNGR